MDKTSIENQENEIRLEKLKLLSSCNEVKKETKKTKKEHLSDVTYMAVMVGFFFLMFYLASHPQFLLMVLGIAAVIGLFKLIFTTANVAIANLPLIIIAIAVLYLVGKMLGLGH